MHRVEICLTSDISLLPLGQFDLMFLHLVHLDGVVDLARDSLELCLVLLFDLLPGPVLVLGQVLSLLQELLGLQLNNGQQCNNQLCGLQVCWLRHLW